MAQEMGELAEDRLEGNRRAELQPNDIVIDDLDLQEDDMREDDLADDLDTPKASNAAKEDDAMKRIEKIEKEELG